jgi:hypothetical protein
MKYMPIIFALSLAILYIAFGLPPSVYNKVACVALGLALLYFVSRAKASDSSAIPGEEPGVAEAGELSGGPGAEPGAVGDGSRDTPLDNDLVARILDNLKREPSEQLHEMLAPPSAGKWSSEALQAARLLLDQRSNNIAPEPVYRTVPRTEQDQSSRAREAVAPGFSRKLLALDVGSRVYCPWRRESGTIIRWHDKEERFYIRYDNGEGEWATLGMFE